MTGPARARRRPSGEAAEDPMVLLQRRVAAELADHPGVNLHLEGPDAFMLVAELQLALRHPGNTGAAAEVARRVVAVIGRTLGPAAQQVIEAGWRE